MTSERQIKLGRRTALISFLFGTTIFGLYFWTSSFGVVFFGYLFILVTGLVNLGILIAFLLKADKDQGNKTKLLRTCGLMLLNIPIMFFYCWVVVILLNTMRITFTNTTQTTLTNINVVGCGGGHIDNLEIGESETVWVDITGDCSISISYLFNGQQKEESVVGYTTGNNGDKMKFNVGEQNE